MSMTPIDCYQADLCQQDFQHDPAQEQIVFHLQQLYEDLTARPVAKRGLLSRITHRISNKELIDSVRGLYLWGGVGRGKTYLMDMFFDCLPFTAKKRTHFHRFMHRTHEQLKTLREQTDPLAIVAQRFSISTRVLCFDEFVVNDIGDAMILGGLLKHLLSRKTVLVATSNIPPDELYKDGLQRDRFQPAIELIKEHTKIVHIAGDVDYRLQFLDRANTYFSPLGGTAETGLLHNFEHIAPETDIKGATLEIDGRDIQTVRHAADVVWFDFEALCAGPRSQNDYLEIARCFHTVFVSNILQLDAESDDKARRLINLVDILYDHNVKLLVSAAAAPSELYIGTRMRDEFARTASRLTEMQTHEYLAKTHIA
jgi:cell division protein ZapE